MRGEGAFKVRVRRFLASLTVAALARRSYSAFAALMVGSALRSRSRPFFAAR